jgi:hypothetical protein
MVSALRLHYGIEALPGSQPKMAQSWVQLEVQTDLLQ